MRDRIIDLLTRPYMILPMALSLWIFIIFALYGACLAAVSVWALFSP